jgi:hypothetical protein
MRKTVLLLAALALLLTASGCNRIAGAPPADNTLAPSEGTPAPGESPAAPGGDMPADGDLSPSPSETATAPPASEVSDALAAYKAALLNNDALEDFLEETAESGKTLTPSRFAVLDLDGDGMPEAVVELSDGYPYFYEVLLYEDGNMYARVFSLREFNDLKDDGTFSWAASAGESGYARLRFNGPEFDMDSIAYTTAEIDGDAVTQSYFVNGEPVTQEQYEAFVTKEIEKPAAPWHDFTRENIESVLSGE